MQINNMCWPWAWIMGKVRSGGNMRSPGTLLQANGWNGISNRRGQMAIDLQWQNGLINWPPSRHVLTGFLQLWKMILFKIKQKVFFFFLEETERRECADVGSVKDGAVHRCCCCWDQDLCYCCYCQPGRLSMKGGLLWKSCACVSVCASADVSVDLCVYSACVFFSVWVRVKRQDWLATVLAADTGGWQGGKHAAIPWLLFSTSYSFYCLSQSRCVLSLYASLCSFFFISLLLLTPPPHNNKVPFWEEWH